MPKNYWFENQFIPSLCDRMNNPKYPRSVVLTDRQADICRMYMSPIQCHSDYGYFTIYQKTINGILFQMTFRGRYTFLSRDMTENERTQLEIERKLEKEAKEAELINRIKSDPVRLNKRIAREKERLQRLVNKKSDAEEDLNCAIEEGDKNDIAHCQEWLQFCIDEITECEKKLASLEEVGCSIS